MLALALAIVLVQEGNFVEDWLFEMGLELTFESERMGESVEETNAYQGQALFKFFASLVQ